MSTAIIIAMEEYCNTRDTEKQALARRNAEVANEDLILDDAYGDAMMHELRKGKLVGTPKERFDLAVHCVRQNPSGHMIKLLLEDKKTPETFIRDTDPKTGNRLLHVACYRGFPKAAAYLIGKGAPLDALDQKGCDAFHYVLQGTGNNVSVGSEADFLVILRFFLAKKYTRTFFQGQQTAALHLVCERGSVAMAKLLLDAKADVNERESSLCDPMTAVMESVQCLGHTPLHKAARSGSLRLVKLLLERGADCQLRGLGASLTLPVEGCLGGGSMRIAHAIFSWERDHKVDTSPLGDDERGRHKSDHNVNMLREMVQDYLATGDVTGGHGDAPKFAMSERGVDKAEEMLREMELRSESAQRATASKVKRACSNPDCSCEHFDMKECARCGQAWYCDGTCQKAHWKAHKTYCKAAIAAHAAAVEVS